MADEINSLRNDAWLRWISIVGILNNLSLIRFVQTVVILVPWNWGDDEQWTTKNPAFRKNILAVQNLYYSKLYNVD